MSEGVKGLGCFRVRVFRGLGGEGKGILRVREFKSWGGEGLRSLRVRALTIKLPYPQTLKLFNPLTLLPLNFSTLHHPNS
jgi:hypothetical protein